MTQLIEEKNSFIEFLYSEGTERASSNGLSSFMDYIFARLQYHKYDEVSDLLDSVDLDRLAPEYLIGLLRITFPERYLIKSWFLFVDLVRDELIRRGYDGNTELQGLK
jgi:hypothetical protein